MSKGMTIWRGDVPLTDADRECGTAQIIAEHIHDEASGTHMITVTRLASDRQAETFFLTLDQWREISNWADAQLA